jgi:hypothetical protein
VDGQDLGALNLHSRQVDAFTDESEEVALIFASHAAAAFAGAKTQEQMETAIDRRDPIGQAKGILIERYKISGQEAFRPLVIASQTTNIKLFDVAEYLVKTGKLASPGKRTRPSGETRRPLPRQGTEGARKPLTARPRWRPPRGAGSRIGPRGHCGRWTGSMPSAASRPGDRGVQLGRHCRGPRAQWRDLGTRFYLPNRAKPRSWRSVGRRRHSVATPRCRPGL